MKDVKGESTALGPEPRFNPDSNQVCGHERLCELSEPQSFHKGNGSNNSSYAMELM